MKTSTPITVLLAEDHMVVREGLCKLLDAENDIQVVGEASTGREAVEMTLDLRPDVVVMDIAMPSLNGLEATRQILKIIPAARILILSAHNDDAYIERVMQLGAAGYVIKQTSVHTLMDAIREVHKGKTFFSPIISRHWERQHKKTLDRNGLSKIKPNRLSKREMEVLQLIAEGGANKQIAADLEISIKTVEKHRDHLMQKLDIHDTAGLTRYAISTGVIESRVPLILE
ncbi:MAG: response regulator transcription factor [Kiritimatiellia bacterium]|nr:response regulator transcription factor [Kiritimatiellia bacterium]